MKMPYTVSVVTGTRAEFGLLRPIAERLQADSDISLQLIVTGAHLCAALGSTIGEIEQSGLPIAFKADILCGDPACPPVLALSRALTLLSDYWKENRPDAVLVLGDRYETFAAATAAAASGIPVAHISGGDTTAGAMDEFYRHSITKMSALHFPICESSRKRVIQLGEDPNTVFNTGSSGAQNLRSVEQVPVDELSADVGFDMTRPFLLCTLHPETLGTLGPRDCAKLLLTAIEAVGMPVLFTAANADEGGAEINDEIASWCAGKTDAKLVQSLGVKRYLSAMRACAAVVGNSSSAIVETPTLKKPAVNIGDRQGGREQGMNIINAAWDASSIEAAIRRAVTAEFAASVKDMRSPYGDGDTAGDIVRILKQKLAEGLSVKKTFYDIAFDYPNAPKEV